MGSRIECIVCEREMHAVVVPKMFLAQHTVSDVSLHACKHCGAEIIPIEEYERIRRKIAGLE